jgi:hypothetical protein
VFDLPFGFVAPNLPVAQSEYTRQQHDQFLNVLRLYFKNLDTHNSSVKDYLEDLTEEALIVVCSDETTALTTGLAKVTFRMPFAFVITEVRASLTEAQTSGNIFTVDINVGGASILSTKLTVDNNETTSVTAATPTVISDGVVADNAVLTIDIDQIGASGAKGLKVTFIGVRT